MPETERGWKMESMIAVAAHSQGGRWEWDDATDRPFLLLCGRSGDKLQCLCRDDWKKSVAGTAPGISCPTSHIRRMRGQVL